MNVPLSTTEDDGRTTASRRWVTAALVALVALAAVGVASVPAAAQTTAEPSFEVQLQEDGSARITVTMTFDLETEDEQLAFGTLQNDSEARATTRDRFEQRMALVASNASDVTGRDMTVEDAAIELSTSDDGTVGIVELSVTWTNLAATGDDGRLVVTEPFASGFTTDRPFTLRGPDGYRLASATPSPADSGGNAATWSAGSDLTGFEAAFERTGGDGTESTPGGTDGGGDGVGIPGFGVGVTLVALLAATGLARVRRR